MATIGKNMKLCVPRDLRAATHAIYAGVLGATVHTPAADIEVFEFGDGRNLGVFYGDRGDALTDAQHAQAIWLEFEVGDVAATTRALLAAGATRVAFPDDTHPYFAAPGGQVFRLAREGGA